jgi:L-threonylcarbamoyladenylate synthase
VPTVPIQCAGRLLRAGGVVAYPTEGVYGFGCLPDDAAAVLRILDIKKRELTQGLVLVAADVGQLDGWISLPDDAPDLDSTLDSTAEYPITWIVPADDAVPAWVRGDHAGLAVRITRHPVAAALCRAARSPLVSTSANVAGRPPARNAHVLRRQFRRQVECIVPGRCGPAKGPSEIRDLLSGKVVRPASS